jgi:hypothetical protein
MIITSIDQVQEHVQVAQNVHYTSLAPYIAIAQTNFSNEWLGAEFTQIIDDLAQFSLGANPTDQQILDAKLVKLTRAVLSNFAVLAAVPFFEVMFSESGITRNETEQSKTAFRGQVKRLEDGLLVNGFNAMEELFLFLDANTVNYPFWADAPGYVQWNKYFFRSAREMNTFYPLKYGRVTFQKLTTHMQHIEDFFLESELGVNQTIALKVLARSTEELEPIEDKVVHNLKRCIVHLALAKAVIEGYIDITPNGAVFVVPSADNTEGNNTTQSELVNPKALQLERVGMDYWGKTIKLMKANEDEFPSYHQYMQEIQEATKLKPLSGGLYMP